MEDDHSFLVTVDSWCGWIVQVWIWYQVCMEVETVGVCFHCGCDLYTHTEGVSCSPYLQRRVSVTSPNTQMYKFCSRNVCNVRCPLKHSGGMKGVAKKYSMRYFNLIVNHFTYRVSKQSSVGYFFILEKHNDTKCTYMLQSFRLI